MPLAVSLQARYNVVETGTIDVVSRGEGTAGDWSIRAGTQGQNQ